MQIKHAKELQIVLMYLVHVYVTSHTGNMSVHNVTFHPVAIFATIVHSMKYATMIMALFSKLYNTCILAASYPLCTIVTRYEILPTLCRLLDLVTCQLITLLGRVPCIEVFGPHVNPP